MRECTRRKCGVSSGGSTSGTLLCQEQDSLHDEEIYSRYRVQRLERVTYESFMERFGVGNSGTKLGTTESDSSWSPESLSVIAKQ